VPFEQDIEPPPEGLALPAGTTAQEFTRRVGGPILEVPPEQPPPADMPPLPLMVLASLADDVETIYTMRSCGDMAPYGVALVGESHLLETLRSLLETG
jgi:hypothetical protein